MQNKKRFFASFFIILFIAIFMLIFAYEKKDQFLFNHFVKDFTKQTLSENALDLHYTLKEPQNYGIYDTDNLPIYQPKDALNTYQDYQNTLLSLEKIDANTLSAETRFTYLVFKDYLKECLEVEKYPYFSEPFTPNSGIHTTLPILLAEYTFYEPNDIENYFEILATLPAYFEGLILYEKEKANSGLFMTSSALNQVVTACEEFIENDDPASHLLATTFKQRLEALSATQYSLTDEEINTYIYKNEQLLKNSVFPAYHSLAEELTLLSPNCNDDFHGLCSYTNGKNYYLALIKRNTGSYRSISDIKEMLFTDFEENYNKLVNLLIQNPQLLENDYFSYLNQEFPLKDSEEMLSYLEQVTKADFPALTQNTNIDVKTISNSLEDYCSPAFYLTVPLDAPENNVIYINSKNALSGIDLFTTLAHEGFPGHLYQTVFFHQENTQNSFSDTSITSPYNVLRNTLYYGGYIEGYALYAESLSYDYALSLCESANIANAQLLCDALKYEWQMQLGLYCLLDIAIHYDGATYQQTKAILNKFGIEDDTNVNTIYQYLLEEPTTYLKYYLGYLEIKTLKQLAQNLWDDDFSNEKFHTFLLSTGPCSFERITQKLEEE